MSIYCAECNTDVPAELVNGDVIYPHRHDLHSLPFWQCPHCHNFVGCHHKTKDRTRALGCIPGPQLKKERQRIHKLLDPIWKSGRYKRKAVYSILSKELGWKFHTAQIRSVDEAQKIFQLIEEKFIFSKKA